MTEPKGRKSLEPWLRDEIDFYPHQIDAVRILFNVNSFILADDMGLGKTLEAMAIMCVDVLRGLTKKAIIICPVSIKENWIDEFEKFTRIPATLLDGSPAKRKKQLEDFKASEGPKVLVTNYEQIKSHLTELNKMKFDLAVFDEAHYIKNPNSARTKAALALKASRNFMLTGTPLLNNVNELWSLLHKIDPLKWPSYWRFVNRYCVYGGYQDRQIVGVKNANELQTILNELMLRRLSKDVLDLKDPVPIVRYVTLTKQQQELYDSAKNDLVLVDIETGEEKDIDNALVKFLRLKQICGTTLAFTGEDHSAKFDRAIQDSLQIYSQGDKAIVFSQFMDTINGYQKRLEEEGIPTWVITGRVKAADRQGIVREWASDPRPGVIICGLQVAGIGLNMTAARYVQFIDKLYVPGLNEQAIARANRIGQDITKAVVVVYYIAKDTIEARIEAILRTKENTFKTIIEMNSSWKAELLKTLKENI